MGDLLYAVKRRLLDIKSGTGDLRILIRGDSNATGDWGDNGSKPHQVIASVLQSRGVYRVSIVNQAYPGDSWAEFQRCPWPSDGVDLLICAYGMNNAYKSSRLAAMQAEFANAMNAVRYANPLSSLAVLVVSPISAFGSSVGDAEWREPACAMLQTLSRAYGAAFLDATSLAPNPSMGGGLWMNPDGKHAGTILNIALWSAVADFILPASEAIAYKHD